MPTTLETFSCLEPGHKPILPDVDRTNRHPAFVRFFERAKLRSCAKKSGSDFPFRYRPLTGTAKYVVLTPFASMALPVISPLSLMSLAVSSLAEKLPFSSLRSVGMLP
jgi:hypothetical protein